MEKTILVLKDLGLLDEIKNGVQSYASRNVSDDVDKEFICLMIDREGDRLIAILVEQMDLHVTERELDNLLSSNVNKGQAKLTLLVLREFILRVCYGLTIMRIWVREMKQKHQSLFVYILEQRLREDMYKSE